MKTKCLGYCRVSTLMQENSLQIQQDEIATWAKSQDYELIHIIVHEGISGTSLCHRRDDIYKYLEQLSNGDVFVVTKQDRLTRNLADIEELVALFKRRNIRLVILKGLNNTLTRTFNRLNHMALNALPGQLDFMEEYFWNLTHENLNEEEYEKTKKYVLYYRSLGLPDNLAFLPSLSKFDKDLYNVESIEELESKHVKISDNRIRYDEPEGLKELVSKIRPHNFELISDNRWLLGALGLGILPKLNKQFKLFNVDLDEAIEWCNDRNSSCIQHVFEDFNELLKSLQEGEHVLSYDYMAFGDNISTFVERVEQLRNKNIHVYFTYDMKDSSTRENTILLYAHAAMHICN